MKYNTIQIIFYQIWILDFIEQVLFQNIFNNTALVRFHKLFECLRTKVLEKNSTKAIIKKKLLYRCSHTD